MLPKPYRCCAPRNHGMHGVLCQGWMQPFRTTPQEVWLMCGQCGRVAVEPQEQQQ